MNQLTETSAPVGMDVLFRVWLTLPEDGAGSGRAADFVVVYSRPANSEAYTTARCALLPGEGPCAIPGWVGICKEVRT